jgi:deazaflavin-dependent oxidoreductase (nitroreductase family)
LLLTTTGRRTGKQRRVVVEAIHRNREQDFYYVTPGFGPKTHWFRNLQRQPLVCVMAGRRRFQAVAETLPLQDATRELRDYMRRHPLSMKLMLWLLRLRIDDIASQEEFQALAQWMPVVALRQRKG